MTQAALCADGPLQRPKLDESIRVLEGLAASGLRSIRYALEVSASSHHSSKLRCQQIPRSAIERVIHHGLALWELAEGIKQSYIVCLAGSDDAISFV